MRLEETVMRDAYGRQVSDSNSDLVSQFHWKNPISHFRAVSEKFSMREITCLILIQNMFSLLTGSASVVKWKWNTKILKTKTQKFTNDNVVMKDQQNRTEIYGFAGVVNLVESEIWKYKIQKDKTQTIKRPKCTDNNLDLLWWWICKTGQNSEIDSC